MKTKFFAIILFIIIGISIIWYANTKAPNAQLEDFEQSNIDAFANIDPKCADGCVEGEDMCYCHGWHPLKRGLPPT